MTSGANGEWVRQGTPRDDNADWNEEQSEYGTALSPTEWDDYSSEQSVPVAAPRAQVPEGSPADDSPSSPMERNPEPVPGQEPDSEGEYRSDETGEGTEADPIGDADESGIDPLRVAPPGQPATTAFVPENDAPVTQGSPVENETVQTTRPRPVVPDGHASEAIDEDDDDPMDAAEYLAVDPVPAPVGTFEDEPMAGASSPGSPARDMSSHGEDPANASDLPLEDADALASDDTDEQQPYDDDEMEATQAVPVTVVAADPSTTGTVPDGLYRGDGAEPTAVIAEGTYPDVDVEEERMQARLDAERTAREQRLGAVATSSENATRDDSGPARVTTDRFFPSFSLFVLRLVTASILGLTSWQILGSGVDATANYLAGFPLIPEPRLMAWILGFTLGALALLLVIGLLQRLVGFLLLVVAVASLTFIRWGNFSIFDANTAGFIGDKDLLLAAIGLLLLGMGGGRWGIDGAFRASRAASKAEREG